MHSLAWFRWSSLNQIDLVLANTLKYMHEDHLGLVGRVGVVTTLGSVTLPCLAARAHVRCHVLAGQGRPRLGCGLAAASHHAATPPRCCVVGHAVLLLWHHAVLLLLTSSPCACGLAPCCLAPSPRLNGAVAAHATLPNCLRARTFSSCVVS